jgi:hypothetical protein
VAYQANTDESLWLIDPARKAQHEKSFRTNAAKIADQELTNRLINDAASGQVNFGGYLADELKNITFGEEELRAATEMLSWWSKYYHLDGEIRRLDNAGKHQEAVVLCLGMAEGQSNWAYFGFDKALDNTIAINKREFDKAVARGFGMLSGLDFVAPLLSIAVVVLSWFGLQFRIIEYYR